MKNFVFTCGDPNGIGPEISVKAINKAFTKKDKIYFVCPKKVFEYVSNFIKPVFPYEIISNVNENTLPGKVSIIDIPCRNISPGKPTKTSGQVSFKAVQQAIKLLKSDKTEAVITAPISKQAWELAGIKYSGHTDLFAETFNAANHAMVFYSKEFIASMISIHIDIKSVPKKVTKANLNKIIQTVANSLVNDFGKSDYKIAVLGLNPHAGEEGRIGKEENDVIKPVIKKLGNSKVEGPFVPDAFFGTKSYKKYDAVIGMYHDQILIPFKMLYFDKGVNFTAGLPIVRTSPDHGTAFDIAYQGKANFNSLYEAYKVAEKIVAQRKHTSSK